MLNLVFLLAAAANAADWPLARGDAKSTGVASESLPHDLDLKWKFTTGKDGSFELKGLPPGSYTIAAVHEKYGEQEMKITVGPKDNKQGVVFEFRP